MYVEVLERGDPPHRALLFGRKEQARQGLTTSQGRRRTKCTSRSWDEETRRIAHSLSEEKSKRGKAHRSRRTMAYLAYVEFVCEEQRSIAPLFSFEKNDRWHQVHHRSSFYVSKRDRFRLVGQSLSAFCTSSLENVSAVGSSHSLSETVLLLSLTLFGLISSEHSGTSLIFGIRKRIGQ